MNKQALAKELVKVASLLVAGTIKEGDVCTVDMRQAKGNDFGTGHQMKILRDVIRQGDGKVVVDSVRGDTAHVYSHDNPMSRIMGGVDVNVSALTKVASLKTASPSRRFGFNNLEVGDVVYMHTQAPVVTIISKGNWGTSFFTAKATNGQKYDIYRNTFINAAYKVERDGKTIWQKDESKVASIKTAAAGPYTILEELHRDIRAGREKFDFDKWSSAMGHARGADYMVEAGEEIARKLVRLGMSNGGVTEDEAWDYISQHIDKALKENEQFKGMTAESVHKPWCDFMDNKIKGYNMGRKRKKY